MVDVDKLIKQRDEFFALRDLSAAFERLPAVVDDSYPEMRHYYESELRKFLRACAANGRFTGEIA